jgi:DNA-binding transcriptional LysR family regulator
MSAIHRSLKRCSRRSGARRLTRAAAQLGVSQPPLSHKIGGLETLIGRRFLWCTTRSVSTIGAGEQLYHAVAPRFDQIDAELAAFAGPREKPTGTIRINAADHPVGTVIGPNLKPILPG